MVSENLTMGSKLDDMLAAFGDSFNVSEQFANLSVTTIVCTLLTATLCGVIIYHVEGYEDEEKTRPISKEFRFDSQDPNGQLKQFLREVTPLDGSSESVNNRLFSGGGLWRHATVTIRGIYYKMTPEQIADEEFNNVVFTTANPAVDSDLVLNSADTHQVRLIGDARHIYQWAEHDVYFTREDLVNWLGGSVQIGSRTYSASQLYLTTCR